MVVATVNKASVKRGHQVTIAASTIPSEAKLTIKLQKLVGGSWLTFAKTVTDKSGKHSFKWSTITPGTYQMRVVVVGFGVSNTVSFKVTK
jgi:5-hydroxyisourate hydrolase-like protein (transthyretin family)